MGMTTYVVGLRSPDNPIYQKHLKVWNACREAGVSLPKETEEFLGDYDSMEDMLETNKPFCTKVFDPMNVDQDVWEVKVKDIPEDVDVIRFINSY